MKRFLPAINLPLIALLVSTITPTMVSANAVAPGEAAPAFRATDAAGQSHTLSEYIGNWIVLEWFNPECSEVQEYYSEGLLPELQTHYQEQGVVWLTIISEGRNGDDYLEADETLEVAEEMGLAASAPVLRDTAGVMGRAFGAQVTPHMYVINPQGVLMYTGALTDTGSPDGENYLVEALEAAMAGEEVPMSATRPQGCTIDF
ncbi:redoxin domain-containing protein [Marinimicrobium sp. ABcell2]|uniref:redoxin domain-containing protein n=1 Tax=Marinimicrobium sp. ABcell2 TaxID=3069751 RepID=UPI0027B09046|nr:redoxin domain-containing protein [Marinimicrobium sp. ABcell2]MDQ2077771.1 redoxin domain-containing protein [Marinimicrobium sp. ABcell2]